MAFSLFKKSDKKFGETTDKVHKAQNEERNGFMLGFMPVNLNEINNSCFIENESFTFNNQLQNQLIKKQAKPKNQPNPEFANLVPIPGAVDDCLFFVNNTVDTGFLL